MVGIGGRRGEFPQKFRSPEPLKQTNKKATPGAGVCKGKACMPQGGCFLVAASSPVPTTSCVCRRTSLHPQNCSSNRTTNTV